jgi:transposase
MAWPRSSRRRYPSDLTDAEWALIEAQIPPARRGDRPRDVNVREVLNGIFYVLSTGCQWKSLPKDLPSVRADLICSRDRSGHDQAARRRSVLWSQGEERNLRKVDDIQGKKVIRPRM